MKTVNFFLRTNLFFAATIFATCVILPPPVRAQQQFASPDAAIQALLAATKNGDQSAVDAIFGPDAAQLLTGDAVQDKNNFRGFSRALAAACVPATNGDNQIILNIGTNSWPFPIPLAQTNGQWIFDTAAGEEEIINRHVGRDELNAIGVCRAYVTAQKQYFSQLHDDSVIHQYATKFKSTSGLHDGLYWKSDDTGSSPFSALVAEAHAEGYGHNHDGQPHPFHGYLFKILTKGSGSVPGIKPDYIVDYAGNGNLTGGFALVAYPVTWGQSGIMTFIVNQNGNVYQRNLGEKTAGIAAGMTLYNPDENWTLVSDSGILEQQ